MGKALIITFKDEEETTFNELVHFLRRKFMVNLDYLFRSSYMSV